MLSAEKKNNFMEETIITSYPVNTCFVCGTEGKQKYQNLDDRNFGHSKGWNLSECGNKECGLLWLNPMPTKKDIGKAYESYYTHGTQKKSILDFSFLEKPYLAARYNYFPELSFLKKLIGYAVYLIPILKNKFEFGVLYLKPVNNGKVLDFGCGSGWVLDNLKQGGWECYGLDFDAKAVEFCKSKGLKVNLGDIPSQNYPDNYFDAITINHVIEHVHEVDELLQHCFQKLKKGGRLVITTPNTQNWQHHLYGKYWFQLDPPRHLHIFNTKNIATVVKRNNFTILQLFSSVRMDAWSTTVSRAIIKRGRFVIGVDKKSYFDFFIGIIHQNISFLYTKINKNVAGEIVLIATKE
jgi:2-polyprenyl-3-methyl-5-hydroxy-6-metoxy-1,4-benzoquinol methylase